MIIGSKVLPKPTNSQEVDVFRLLEDLITDLRKILNRGIIFDDNINCRLVTFTSSATPDAANTVAHTLGSVPTGYIIYSQNKAGSLYLGGSAWTSNSIYLKSSTASVEYKVIIF